jgi:hypothetical protein
MYWSDEREQRVLHTVRGSLQNVDFPRSTERGQGWRVLNDAAWLEGSNLHL